MTAERTCDLEPFSAQIVAQVRDLESAGSALQLFIQQLEGYLARFKEAVCDDFIEIVTDCCGGGPTAISFLDLTDTPASYAGSANYAVTVNAGATGLEFTPVPTPPTARPDISTRLVALIKPDSGTTRSTTGNSQVTIAGTTSTQGPTGASPLTNALRLRSAGAAIAGSQASIRSTIVLVYGSGGWRCVIRFGTPTAQATQRAFVGLVSVTGILPNANPSALTNVVGVGYDSGATNLFILHNDAAGACTPVDLGVNFPVDTTSFYEMEIWMEPGSGVANYRVLNIGTGAVATGVINTDLPADTVGLTHQAWCNSGVTATPAIIDTQCIYTEMFQ